MLVRSVTGTKPMSQMKKMETKEAVFRTRKRILKYLVLGYLRQEGYSNTAETFTTEAGVTTEYELCDNIDLDIMLQDYCSYYMMKFNKQPQFCKLTADRAPPPRQKTRPPPVEKPVMEACEEPDLPAALAVTRLMPEDHTLLESVIPAVERKPLAGFIAICPPDRRPLAEQLYQDIIRPVGVSWDDIKGLGEAKSLLMESVVYPVRYPSVFTGLLSPWRGVLLHGPPGAGKTMLARAAADLSRCTFFNVSCSSVVNKWRGEGEKIVKTLFDMASYYSPSIIFIDEVETLASERSACGEHEASRRLKSQLLVELDGITRREGVVFLLANSNMPWEIDPAMLRRLEKRIYIPLPDLSARVELFRSFLVSPSIELVQVEWGVLGAKTGGYSGSDIKAACKEALMATVRKILPDMEGRRSNPNRRERLEMADILKAIEKTKPVSKNLAKRHEDWQNQMGCS